LGDAVILLLPRNELTSLEPTCEGDAGAAFDLTEQDLELLESAGLEFDSEAAHDFQLIEDEGEVGATPLPDARRSGASLRGASASVMSILLGRGA
jgi:hypothetical protein